MITEKLKKGQLLIAEPSIIGDLSFNRSVILLADHNQEGSVGFIINKPLKPSIKFEPLIINNRQMQINNVWDILL